MADSSSFRVRHCRLACAVIWLAAAAAAAEVPETPTETQPTAAAVQSSNQNRLVCVREYVTGSMIPKKVCRTRAQIDAEHKAHERWAEEMRRNSSWSTQNPDH